MDIVPKLAINMFLTPPVGMARKPKSFMDFPEDVRKRILKHAGLVKDGSIGFTREAVEVWVPPTATQPGRQQMSRNRPLPTALLFLNRRLHYEAKTIFYGENTFHVFYMDQQALQRLKSLPPQTLAMIRNLRVMFDLHRKYMARHDYAPLVAPDFPFEDLLEGQREIFDFLYHTVAETKCRLSIKLDCRTVSPPDVAWSIFNNLYMFRPIHEIQIKLGGLRHLYTFPQNVLVEKQNQIRIAKGTLPAGCQFPFPRLLWFPEIANRILSLAGMTNFNRGLVFDANHYYGYRRCGSCDPEHVDCYCNTHSDTTSSTCVCWTPTIPLNILLVNKAMYEEASRAFFTTNKFLIRGEFREILIRLLSAAHRHLHFIRELALDLRDTGDVKEWTMFFQFCQQWGHEHLRLTIRLESRILDLERLAACGFMDFLIALLWESKKCSPEQISIVSYSDKHPITPHDGPLLREEVVVFQVVRRQQVDGRVLLFFNGSAEGFERGAM